MWGDLLKVIHLEEHILLNDKPLEDRHSVIFTFVSPVPSSVPGTQQVFDDSYWMDGWLDLQGKAIKMLSSTFIAPDLWSIIQYTVSP